jgi:hypothetical protein
MEASLKTQCQHGPGLFFVSTRMQPPHSEFSCPQSVYLSHRFHYPRIIVPASILIGITLAVITINFTFSILELLICRRTSKTIDSGVRTIILHYPYVKEIIDFKFMKPMQILSKIETSYS